MRAASQPIGLRGGDVSECAGESIAVARAQYTHSAMPAASYAPCPRNHSALHCSALLCFALAIGPAPHVPPLGQATVCFYRSLYAILGLRFRTILLRNSAVARMNESAVLLLCCCAVLAHCLD